jgi:methionine synthase I (cobalamin-dependent)
MTDDEISGAMLGALFAMHDAKDAFMEGDLPRAIENLDNVNKRTAIALKGLRRQGRDRELIETIFDIAGAKAPKEDWNDE